MPPLARGAAVPPEQIGLFVGVMSPTREACRELGDSIQQRGLLRLDVDAFTRSVASAAGGACARALGLRGPFSTLSTGAGSGVVALAAIRYLQSHPDTLAIAVVALDQPLASPDRAIATVVTPAGSGFTVRGTRLGAPTTTTADTPYPTTHALEPLLAASPPRVATAGGTASASVDLEKWS